MGGLLVALAIFPGSVLVLMYAIWLASRPCRRCGFRMWRWASRCLSCWHVA